MQATFRAKLKGINAKDNGTVVQLEPQAGYAAQIVELMSKVGMYIFITAEDEQGELFDIEDGSVEAEYSELPALPEPEVDDEDNE